MPSQRNLPPFPVPSCARSLLLREVRIVPVGLSEAAGQGPGGPVDLRIEAGVVTEVGPGLEGRGEEEIGLGGRYLLPGLWDRHVHWDQWAATLTRLDMSGTGSARSAIERVATAVRTTPDDGNALIGFGHRSAGWPDVPTVADLDRVTGERPVVLVSGDAHHGWLNSAAMRRLGVAPRDGIIAEREWFDLMPRLGEISGPPDQEQAFASAARMGVVGIVDMEFGAPFAHWPERYPASRRRLKVRAATYPEHLERAIAAGLRSGDEIEGTEGMVRMGPLKIISDGSLNTRTAFCCEPYLDAETLEEPRGVVNYPPAELTALLRRAHGAGLDVAVHAIGDAAVTEALDSIASAGADAAAWGGTEGRAWRPSVEHAQLMLREDLGRMAELGVVASVQPAHLLDDRDVTWTCWGDRGDRCFLHASMLDAGVEVALGSDAPVSRLDPWLAMAAAVFRSGDLRGAWNPAENLTPAQAFACSTDGRGTVGVGSPGDVIVLDADPTRTRGEARPDADAIRHMRPVLTVVAGGVTHRAV